MDADKPWLSYRSVLELREEGQTLPFPLLSLLFRVSQADSLRHGTTHSELGSPKSISNQANAPWTRPQGEIPGLRFPFPNYA